MTPSMAPPRRGTNSKPLSDRPPKKHPKPSCPGISSMALMMYWRSSQVAGPPADPVIMYHPRILQNPSKRASWTWMISKPSLRSSARARRGQSIPAPWSAQPERRTQDEGGQKQGGSRSWAQRRESVPRFRRTEVGRENIENVREAK